MAKSRGSRLLQIGVDPAVVEQLVDFRKAYWEASEVRIIEAALRDFMDKWLAEEPKRKEFYEAARKARDP